MIRCLIAQSYCGLPPLQGDVLQVGPAPGVRLIEKTGAAEVDLCMGYMP